MDGRTRFLLAGLVLVVFLASPALAFGAGNISSKSSIEGINWRHGDIEDALLGILMARAMNKKNKKFNKLMVSRVYFGNWLRDYSQAVDVGTIKSVSYEAIRLVVAILAFMNFGFGSKEFEVTPERLGCYRPEEHIDNPKGYAPDDDARRYWHGLRGPVDEELELDIDPETGMKNYIANEHVGITNSATLLKQLLGQCVEHGRRHGRDKSDEDLYECLRLMGTALHCLEDFFAHSNYVELALIEMGEREIFPHVGRDTRFRLEGSRRRVYPIVTGTFGEVDFLHSVAGELSDKVMENEMQELQAHLEDSKKTDTSLLRTLLDMIPDGLFGGEHQSDKMSEIQENCTNAQMEGLEVRPHREPEEMTKWVGNIFRQVVPIIEWHDRIMKAISDALPTIPIIPKIIEQLEDQLNAFVHAQIAPFVVPVLQQIQNEMGAGSQGIIESSKENQHNVLDNDEETNPTHSMLSKDHFTNLLNEPAGKTAAEMVKWVVPQLMEAIDNEDIDVDQMLDRIISGVLHHPCQRDMGVASDARNIFFSSVEAWWNEMDPEKQDDYRRRLSREGVENHENHKEGEWDSGHGHGCLGKLEQATQHGGKEKKESWDDKIATAAANAIVAGVTGAVSDFVPEGAKKEGGIAGILGSLLGGVLGGDDKKDSSGGGRGNEDNDDNSHHNYSSYNRPSSRHDKEFSEERPARSYDSSPRPTGGHADSFYNHSSSSGGGYGGSDQSRGYGEHHQSSYGGDYGQQQQAYGSYGGHHHHSSSEYSHQQPYGGGYQQQYSGAYQQSSSGYYDGSQQESSREDPLAYGSYNPSHHESSYGGHYQSSGYPGQGHHGQHGHHGGSSGYGGPNFGGW